MSLFELLFIALFLAAVGLLLRGLFLVATRRTTEAARTGLALGALLGSYALVLVSVSLASSGDVVAVGEEQRFDDWAIAVTGVERVARIGTTVASGEFWIVTTRVSSHARGRRQRETDVHVFLVDGGGHRYEISPSGQEALEREQLAGTPLTSFLDPGSSFVSRLVFELPASAENVAFVKRSHSWFPGLLILGDPASFLHPPTRVPLDGRRGEIGAALVQLRGDTGG